MINAASIALGHDLSVLHDNHGAGACAIAIATLVESKRDRRFEALGFFDAQLHLNI